MNTRVPIDWTDIQAGDSIRWEGDDRTTGHITALEYRATHDEHRQFSDGSYFLLDRPEPQPKIELPAEPTLGWLGWEAGGLSNASELGIWSNRTHGAKGTHLTSWTPAAAVPRDALEELRDAHENAFSAIGRFEKNNGRRDALVEFFRRVDSSNGIGR